MADNSTVIYTKGAFPTFLESFCEQVGRRWRSYQLLVGDDWYPQRANHVVLPTIRRMHYEVYFCRNRKMELWWEKHGFETMPSGGGPFGIEFGAAKNVILGLQRPPSWVTQRVETKFDFSSKLVAIAVPSLLCLNFITPGIPGEC